jgi:hypothetical protein
VLGVERLRAQINRARWGKTLQGKWLRWWHLYWAEEAVEGRGDGVVMRGK